MRLFPHGRKTDVASAWRRLAYGSALTALSVLILWSRGFRAITGDHHQYLLSVLQSHTPTFVAGDWFTEQTTPFHYTFQQALTLAARFDAIIPILTAMHVATLAVLCLAIVMMTRYLGAGWWSVPVVLFVLHFGVQRTWGAVELVGKAALPHYAGLSLALLAIAATFGRRYGLASAFLVVTSYVHVSVGAWAGVVLAAMVLGEVGQRRLDLRRLVRPAAGAVIALSPLIVVVASDFVGPASEPETYRILFDLRSPHHYAFGDFGVANHVQAVVVITIALVAEHLGGYQSRALRSAVIAITGIGLSGAFFLYVVYWPLPVRLFPYRLAPLLTGLAVVLAVALLAKWDASRRDRIFGGAAVLVLLAIERSAMPGRVAALAQERPDLAAAVGVSILAALLLAATVVSRGRGLSAFELSAPALTALWLLPATAAVTIGLTLHQPPTHALRWLSPEEQEFGEAVRETVPQGEILVSPPGAEHVRLATERGIVVDFKAFPMIGREMKEWKRRLEHVTGERMRVDGPGGSELREVLTERYRKQPPEALRRVGQRYGAGYLLVHEDSVAGRHWLQEPAAKGRLVGDYVLTPVDAGG